MSSEDITSFVIATGIGIFYIFAGIKYRSAPPVFHVPTTKVGKIIHRIFYCALGGLIIYCSIDLFVIK